MPEINKSKRIDSEPALRTEKATKSVLVLENPTRHGFPYFSRAKDSLESSLKINLVIAEGVSDALLKLGSAAYDLVIVHHYSFSEIGVLRAKYPDVKYAVHTAAICDGSVPGTFGEEFRLKLDSSYDFFITPAIIEPVSEQIEKILGVIDIK